MENRKVGDVCYFKRGAYFGKCVITKVIVVTDEKETVVNYEIRLYGKDKTMQVVVEEIFDSFDDAKNCLLNELKDVYKTQTAKISADKESKFDSWEAQYQEEISNRQADVEKNMKNNV